MRNTDKGLSSSHHRPKITGLSSIVVMGVGGGGGNAINNMLGSGLEGVTLVAANTDAQALAQVR